jgi:hypothetical protein
MSKRRTAQGKIIDMRALAAKNEHTRAVGNMKVNARGDEIDSTGKVITPITEKVAKIVGNKSAQVRPPSSPAKQREMTKEEIELEQQLEADFEVENIKKNSK